MRYAKKATAARLLIAAGALALATAAQAETFVVDIDGRDFVYDGNTNLDIDLTIMTGDTVQWQWVSGFHNVVSGMLGAPDAGDLFRSGDPTGDVGTQFSFTFEEIGTYDYFCEVHGASGMVSQVNVVPAPGSLLALAPMGLVLTRRRR